MMKSYYLLSLLFCLFLVHPMLSQKLEEEVTLSEEEQAEMYRLMYQSYLDSVAGTIEYQTGLVTIGSGLAELNVPEGYKFVDSETAEMILVDLWGNPPSAPTERSLGMLFPEEGGPNDLDGYGIDINYTADGYISDKEASKIDYDELLEGMQADIKAANPERIAQGYGSMRLVGWASSPYYDQNEKKLHWAKELNFEEAADNTLNYNILFLGRKGYLQLNVIGDMTVLPDVKANIDPILASVSFKEGYRYEDYQPGVDKVAAYGIGALVAGKVLAKAGLFAKIGIFLAKGWKLILLAGIGIVAGAKKLMGRGNA